MAEPLNPQQFSDLTNSLQSAILLVEQLQPNLKTAREAGRWYDSIMSSASVIQELRESLKRALTAAQQLREGGVK